jgi:hypothetical protein
MFVTLNELIRWHIPPQVASFALNDIGLASSSIRQIIICVLFPHDFILIAWKRRHVWHGSPLSSDIRDFCGIDDTSTLLARLTEDSLDLGRMDCFHETDAE